MFRRFRKRAKTETLVDARGKRPEIRCSICTGEQVAGFQDEKTGAFEEVCCIKSDADLAAFREQYGITGDIEKIY